MTKRRLLIALCLALVLSLWGCEEPGELPGGIAPPSDEVETPGPETETADAFSLPYDAASPLHPASVESGLNLALFPLLYDSLFTIDENFQVTGALCQSWEGEGATLTLHLRADARFEDGTALSAGDAAAALESYRKEGYWAGALASVSRVRAVDDRTLVLSLYRPDSGLIRRLTMPIYRAGDDGAPPAGTGRYRYGLADDGQATLRRNENWYGGAAGLSEIELYPVKSDDMLLYGLTSGHISMVRVEKLAEDGPAYRGSYDTLTYPTLSMHYLAINTRTPGLHSAAARRALSLCLERDEMIQTCYGDFADEATLPVHPLVRPSAQQGSGRAAAETILLEAGFQKGEAETWQTPDGRPLALRLMVNSGNDAKRAAADMLAAQLRAAGFSVVVEAVPFSEMEERLAAGDFDLCLAETRLSADMDVGEMVRVGGALNFGGFSSPKETAPPADGEEPEPTLDQWLDQMAAAWNEAERTVAEDGFYGAFSREMPFIPLCFEREALLFRNEAPAGARPVDIWPLQGFEKWRFTEEKADG